MKTHENGETPDDPLFRRSEITFQEQYEASRIVPVLSRDSPGDGSLLPAVRGRRELAGSAPGLHFRHDPLFLVSPGPENVEIAIWEVEFSSVCNAALAGGAVKIWWRSEHSSRRRPLLLTPCNLHLRASPILEQVRQRDFPLPFRF